MSATTGDWRNTAVTDLLGLRLPIVLGPFGGASSIELVTAVSNAGGLGSYGLYGLDAGRIGEVASELRAATDRPFALNLWLPHGDVPAPDEAQFDTYLEVLEPYFIELGLPLPARPDRYLVPFAEQIDATLEARPAAVSFVYGVPDASLVARCHAAGILVDRHRDHRR